MKIIEGHTYGDIYKFVVLKGTQLQVSVRPHADTWEDMGKNLRNLFEEPIVKREKIKDVEEFSHVMMEINHLSELEDPLIHAHAQNDLANSIFNAIHISASHIDDLDASLKGYPFVLQRSITEDVENILSWDHLSILPAYIKSMTTNREVVRDLIYDAVRYYKTHLQQHYKSEKTYRQFRGVLNDKLAAGARAGTTLSEDSLFDYRTVNDHLQIFRVKCKNASLSVFYYNTEFVNLVEYMVKISRKRPRNILTLIKD